MPKRTLTGKVTSNKTDKTITVLVRRKIMFELDGVSEIAAKEALSLAAAKLPMHTKVVKRLGE